SRSRSTCPWPTRSPATQRRGRSTCTRPRHSRRTSRVRCRHSVSRGSAARSTTGTPSRSGAGRFASGRTSSSPTPTCSTSGAPRHHARWDDVFATLRFVVVDEAHVYRGVFGSHVANVLRRLLRIARLYDAEPQLLLASATIANAGELAHALSGRSAAVIEHD